MPTAYDLSMLDGDELSSRLGESRRELFNLRFQLATGQLDNPSAKLAAEDTERDEKAALRQAAAEAEAGADDLHDHDHDHPDDDDEEDEA